MRVVPGDTWVVYETPAKGVTLAGRAVCQAGDWAALVASKPGIHTLVMAGLTNEGVAERMARGTSGDRVKSDKA